MQAMPEVADGARQRCHQRVAVYRDARVSTEDRWQDCTIIDLSEEGALLQAGAAPAIGESLILCSEEVGMLAGTVIRHSAEGFAIIFEISGAARTKLLAWLTAHLNQSPAAS